jgi:hypothetical protein
MKLLRDGSIIHERFIVIAKTKIGAPNVYGRLGFKLMIRRPGSKPERKTCFTKYAMDQHGEDLDQGDMQQRLQQEEQQNEDSSADVIYSQHAAASSLYHSATAEPDYAYNNNNNVGIDQRHGLPPHDTNTTYTTSRTASAAMGNATALTVNAASSYASASATDVDVDGGVARNHHVHDGVPATCRGGYDGHTDNDGQQVVATIELSELSQIFLADHEMATMKDGVYVEDPNRTTTQQLSSHSGPTTTITLQDSHQPSSTSAADEMGVTVQATPQEGTKQGGGTGSDG